MSRTARREPQLATRRLLLRRFRDGDLDAFSAMNADPRVMEHFFHGVRTREQTAEFMGRIDDEFERRGLGLWVVEVPGVTAFAGFTGLHEALFEAPFTPAIEVGWRFAVDHWGHGYATEAARAALDFGFRQAGLDEIVSFTDATNRRSWRVMERLGMERDPAGDFDHPAVPPGHPVRPHLLYRMTRERWSATTATTRNDGSTGGSTA
jgi:RimJ/RimL family protein N-acetyltransferase